MEVILIRHTSVDVPPGVCYGQTDVPLKPTFEQEAARLDDVANYIPARLTAFLMVAVSGRFPLLLFVGKYGSKHASPNSGYPEAALAGILDCRFGGPHNYFGEEVWKPYIGDNERPLTTEDMRIAVRINRSVEWIMVIIVVATATCMYVIPSFF